MTLVAHQSARWIGAAAPSANEASVRPIVILGFGRSGTTWVSDIISKVTGGLVLFEPLHPSVTDESRRFAYSVGPSEEDSEELADLMRAILAGRHRRPWLLRNHVPFPLEQMSQEWLDEIWDQCSVVGFKCIRANFMISWLVRTFRARIVLLVRHPCAVVASIVKRKNFWEFGWPGVYELFVKKQNSVNGFSGLCREPLEDVITRVESDVERYALMWAITYARVVQDARRQQLPIFYYEDFYRHPFETARTLFEYLGMPGIRVHPAHLFTPSMTGLRTVHGLGGDGSAVSDGPSVFWRDTLSPDDVRTVHEIVDSFELDLYGPDDQPRPRTGVVGSCAATRREFTTTENSIERAASLG